MDFLYNIGILSLEREKTVFINGTRSIEHFNFLPERCVTWGFSQRTVTCIILYSDKLKENLC